MYVTARYRCDQWSSRESTTPAETSLETSLGPATSRLVIRISRLNVGELAIEIEVYEYPEVVSSYQPRLSIRKYITSTG